MRKSLFLQRLLLSSLVLFLLGGKVQATVTWSGVATDVYNEDLVITADSLITGSVTIHAGLTGTMPHKVTVTLTQDIVLTGSGAPILYLDADDACAIDFRVDHDLTFQGAADGTPLFIAVRGLGTVIFDLCGGNQVTFTKNGVTGGGTQLYVIMDVFSGDKGTTLVFQRYLCEITGETLLNVFVNIGPDSLLGYAASQEINAPIRACFSGNERGIIRFDPSNLLNAPGRMVLNIADTGAFIVGGRYVEDTHEPNLTLDMIDRTLPAGCDAVLQVVNTKEAAGHAGLMITNSNTTPFEYLADPWGNLEVRSDTVQYNGTFSGIQYGFVLGAQGVLDIQEYAYVDYVGLGLDVCPSGFTIPCEYSTIELPCPTINCCAPAPSPVALCDLPLNQLIKKRNYSAFVVDGYLNPLARPALIQFADHSALVFRSGVDRNGVVEHPISIDPEREPNPYVIDPELQSICLGNMVFDVEGFLQVAGPADRGPNKTELLSLEVTFSGAPVLIGGTEVNFPLRTFATDVEGEDLRYNAGYFFYNNCVQMCDTWLVHTDLNHRVYEKDDVNSIPAYIGGETFTIIPGTPRPTLAFINSNLYVHADIAITGMDLLIPNGLDCTCLESCIETPESFIEVCPADIWPVREALPQLFARLSRQQRRACESCDFTTPLTCINNDSAFTFFYNGYRVDAGTGRQMILGTFIGSTACDCCAIINDDAHLDVMQATDIPVCDPVPDQVLSLYSAANDATINNAITGNILNQFENQTIYLGHNSNISIGTHQNPLCPTFTNATNPILDIAGDFFSFETRGGQTNTPKNSSITGQGGIFVDSNGLITIEPCLRANMGVMVTKSDNGQINLPASSVYFDPELGGATWQLDLTVSPIIVPVDNTLSDYTLNWMATIKDPDFVPYIAACIACGPCCLCPAVTTSNLLNIPEVLGTIDQLQVAESRLGDPVHLLVNGGWVRELVFLPGNNSAEAPVGVVVVENDGHVGLGSAHRNVDSLDASVKLGLNGITIVANGSGRVSLNEDIIIDNVCHILRGPDFAATDVLVIDSDCCHTLRVKSSGILDISSFDNSSNTVEFSGQINMIFEPGSKVYLNGATLAFSEEVQINFQPTDKAVGGSLLSDLDPYRVKFFGTGRVLLKGCAKMAINNGAYVGVETNTFCYDVFATDLTFELQNSAQFLIGDGCEPYGGVFQIGDVADFATTITPTVSFTLFVNGPDAKFSVAPQGFFGAGVGITNKTSSIPNNWLVDATWNVRQVNFVVTDGILSHDQIYTGSDANAALFAVGPARQHDLTQTASYTLDFTPVPNPDTTNVSRSTIRGGGNFALITPQLPGQTDSAINPIVLDTTASEPGSRIIPGILASKPLFRADTFLTGEAADLFEFWATGDVAGSLIQYSLRGDVGPGLRNQLRIGYVDGGFIARKERVTIVGPGGTTTTQAGSIDIGAVALRLIAGVAPRDIGTVLALG